MLSANKHGNVKGALLFLVYYNYLLHVPITPITVQYTTKWRSYILFLGFMLLVLRYRYLHIFAPTVTYYWFAVLMCPLRSVRFCGCPAEAEELTEGYFVHDSVFRV